MSELDNELISTTYKTLHKTLNKRELCAVMECIMENVRYTSGNEDKRRAANSYMKIAHGKSNYFGCYLNN